MVKEMLHYKARCQLVRVTSVPVHVHQFFFLYFGDFEVCYAYKISLCGVWGLNLLILGLIGF